MLPAFCCSLSLSSIKRTADGSLPWLYLPCWKAVNAELTRACSPLLSSSSQLFLASSSGQQFQLIYEISLRGNTIFWSPRLEAIHCLRPTSALPLMLGSHHFLCCYQPRTRREQEYEGHASCSEPGCLPVWRPQLPDLQPYGSYLTVLWLIFLIYKRKLVIIILTPAVRCNRIK